MNDENEGLEEGLVFPGHTSRSGDEWTSALALPGALRGLRGLRRPSWQVSLQPGGPRNEQGRGALWPGQPLGCHPMGYGTGRGQSIGRLQNAAG